MSAAATAAGYLFAQGRLAKSDLNGRGDAKSSHRAAEPQPPRRLEPRAVLQQDQSQPVKQLRVPKIEYRKRRLYPLPSAA